MKKYLKAFIWLFIFVMVYGDFLAALYTDVMGWEFNSVLDVAKPLALFLTFFIGASYVTTWTLEALVDLFSGLKKNRQGGGNAI